MLPTVRLSQFLLETAYREQSRISKLVRVPSATLTLQCRQAGLPVELAELCGGLLASVVDDLTMASKLPKSDFERAKRMERVMAATEAPASSALKLAIAASPTNGRACARHWDMICEKPERGKMAWLLGMQTDTAYAYGKRMEKRNA